MQLFYLRTGFNFNAGDSTKYHEVYAKNKVTNNERTNNVEYEDFIPTK